MREEEKDRDRFKGVELRRKVVAVKEERGCSKGEEALEYEERDGMWEERPGVNFTVKEERSNALGE